MSVCVGKHPVRVWRSTKVQSPLGSPMQMHTDRSETVFRMENDLMFNKQESGGSHIYAHTLLSKGVTCLGQSITTSSHGHWDTVKFMYSHQHIHLAQSLISSHWPDVKKKDQFHRLTENNFTLQNDNSLLASSSSLKPGNVTHRTDFTSTIIMFTQHE